MIKFLSVAVLLSFTAPAFASDLIDLGHSGNPPCAQMVTDGATVDARTRIFAKEFRGIGFNGALDNCREMIVLTVGPHDGNHSYGAVCTMRSKEKPHRLLVCDDDMVGHLSMTNTFSNDQEEIARFVEQNCYGG